MGTLAGCGGNAGGGNASSGNDDTITLTIWHIENDTVRQEVVKNAIARFEAENKHIKVEQIPMENDPYKTSLATAMAAGQEPDIFISWGGGWLEAFIEEGKVLDIHDRLEAVSDRYHENILDMFMSNGRRWAIPYRFGPVPVYYNKAIYADLGLEIPATIDDLEANAEILLENGIIPFALGNSSQWPGALTFAWLALREGGPQAFTDAYYRVNGGTFEDPSFVKAGERIQDWVARGFYPEGANGINYDTGGSRMLFYTGRAAHIVQTSSFISNSKSEAPEMFQDIGIFNYPLIETGNGLHTELLGGGNAYSISASTPYPDEAFALILRLTDVEYAQENADIAGLFSAARGVTITDPMLAQVEGLILSSTHLQNFYDQVLPPALGNLHKQTTFDLFGGTTTPEQAARDMEELALRELGPSS